MTDAIDIGLAPRPMPDFLKRCAETLEQVHSRIEDEDVSAAVGGTILALRVRADLMERGGT